MEKVEPSYISPLVTDLLPDASLKERLAAQAALEGAISVLYRVCDRLVRESEDRDKWRQDARLNQTTQET